MWNKHSEILSGSQLGQLTPTFDHPIWQGETDGIVLINADFGMGDTIQYVRFIKNMPNAILRCDEELFTLFECLNIPMIAKTAILPEFKYIIHLEAIPYVLNSKIATEPYLTVNQDKIQKPVMLNVIRSIYFSKIGVCWAGNPFNSRDSERSIPIDYLNSLVVKPGLKFFSLQKQYDPSAMFLDCRGLMDDWNNTAALMSSLELIITVDTAIAHLAGALGLRTWLLLPKQMDTRWNHQWYQHMKIYRQQTDWIDLINQVGHDLSLL
jgi:hypothetical protein